MRKFTNFALAALATMTLVGVSAQERHSKAIAMAPPTSSMPTASRNDGKKFSICRKSTIESLRKGDKSAAELIGSAYGQAVFDTTKGGFIVTGAGGTGVATRKNGGDPVYMHLGAGGVGLGAGLENYKLIVLFENEDTYKRFIDGAWTAGASAQAAAGRDGAASVAKFVNGVAVYHVTDKGVIAQADVTGVKFWPSDKLNPGVA